MVTKFGTTANPKEKTHICKVPIDKIVESYGSPVFVLSEKKIRKNYNKAKTAFEKHYPKVQFAWSYKTNYLNSVCKIYHQEGSWAEVVSSFEYDKAIKNGVSGDKIIFNGPDKSETDLNKAIKNDSLIHVDNFDEITRLINLVNETDKTPRVAVRVNMDVGIYPLWDRFGFNFENGQAWKAIKKIIASDKLNLVGIHTHIGTYMLSTSAYEKAAKVMVKLFKKTKSKYEHVLDYIDMGGGFPSTNTLKGAYLSGADSVPDIEEFAEVIGNTILNSGIKEADLPYLYLESGRALIDDAGYLIGSVLSNKRLSDERRATIVDFGVNIMFTAFWFNHKISPAQKTNDQAEITTLFGPLCMNIDVIRDQINLPLLNPGDKLIVHHMGAYNITQSMQFITLRPPVILIDLEGNTHVIKEKENLSVLEQGDKVPEYLQNI